MENVFLLLLALTPAALVASAAGAPQSAVFFLSALAIVPLAKFIGESVEEITARTSAAAGGILSATFGNATELIIALFALRAGLPEVVKASITGSIIGNLLLVLGLAILAGTWKREKQTFNRMGILASGSTLFIALVALVMPAVLLETAPGLPLGAVDKLSDYVALALILVYAASLAFSLRTHRHLFAEVARYEPRWSVLRASLTLAAATAAVALVSNLLVGSIQPLIAAAGWSQLFVGVIIIAVVGNAAENLSAVLVARRGRMDLSLQIAIGSATQIALFVAPVLVFASVLFAQPMDLVFNAFELVAMILSVLVVNLIVADGEVNWLEGVQLLAAYAIIAVAFFFHP